MRITVIATGFEEQVVKAEEKPERAKTEKLFDDKGVPAYLKRNVKIDYRGERAEVDEHRSRRRPVRHPHVFEETG